MATETTTKKPRNKTDRTPLEHAQRRVKEQISVLVGKTDAEIPRDRREQLVDYLTGLSTAIGNAAMLNTLAGSQPYAGLIALGAAQRSSGAIFAKPAKAD